MELVIASRIGGCIGYQAYLRTVKLLHEFLLRQGRPNVTMHYLPLSCQHVQAMENLLFSPQELQVEHGGRHVREVLNVLNASQVLFHLVLCQLDQVMNTSDFIFKLLYHPFEGNWTILSIFW